MHNLFDILWAVIPESVLLSCVYIKAVKVVQKTIIKITKGYHYLDLFAILSYLLSLDSFSLLLSLATCSLILSSRATGIRSSLGKQRSRNGTHVLIYANRLIHAGIDFPHKYY